jgi:outer membrane protein assembly factor BamB
MMNTRSRRGRQFPRLLAFLALFTFLVLPFARVGAAPKQKAEIPLDLAAMALTPGDLEQAGYTGFGVASVDDDSSGWRTLGDVASDSIAGNYYFSLASPEPIDVGLAQAGWQRQYQRVLADQDPVDPTVVDLAVRSEVGEYSDAKGADDALTLLMTGGVNVPPGDLPIGDRVEIRSDMDPNVGTRLVVAFREGNLIGSVEVTAYGSGDQPAVDLALLLARQLKARFDAELSAKLPGLADEALHLASLSSPAQYEGYSRKDGETLAEWGESPENFADRGKAYSNAVDVFSFDQEIATASKDGVQPFYGDRLYRFPDEKSAQKLLDRMPQFLAEDSANSNGAFDAQLVDDATTFGDDSLTFAIQEQSNAGTSYGYRVYVRVGADISRLQIETETGAIIDHVEAIAKAQTACLKVGSCAAAEQPPLSLPGFDCPPTNVSDNVPDLDGGEIASVAMSGGDPARSGAQPGPGPSGNPLEIWNANVHGGIVQGPVISDGLLVFGSSQYIPPEDPNDMFSYSSEDDYLYAFDAATHAFKWCAPTGQVISDPSIDSGLVFTEANSTKGEHFQTFVVALDEATGLPVWQFPVVSSGDSVTATNGTVYVTTGLGSVFALDEQTGAPRWLYQLPSDTDLSDAILSSPAIADGVLYLTGGGTIYALNAETGEELWDVSADDADELLGAPVVADGVVYVGGTYAIYAVDAQTGDEVWVTNMESAAATRLAVVDGMVYAAGGSEDDPTLPGFIAAFAADTGTEIWGVSLKGFATTPVVAGDVVYIGAGATQDDGSVAGGVYGLSTADGSVLTNLGINGTVTRPVVASSAIYIGSSVTADDGDNGSLYVLGGDSAPADSTPILDRKSG